MNVTFDEPILPASDANASRSQAGDGVQVVLDGDALRQIRSILISAGVTAAMIDLPASPAEKSTVGVPEKSTVVVQEENTIGVSTDVETGTGSIWQKSWWKNRLKEQARSRDISDNHTEYPIEEDIYNMFFLSKNWTFPCFWALSTIALKFLLLGIVIVFIWKKGGFRDEQSESELWPPPPTIRFTQLLLLPVSLFITEELIITMQVLSQVGWAKLEKYPQATKLKFLIANGLRALDGSAWLFIIVSLTFNATQLIPMFLNFAALQFIQSVDNAAFDMARGGYLVWGCETVATNVTTTTLPSKRGTWREYIDTVMMFTIIIVLFIMWALINYIEVDPEL